MEGKLVVKKKTADRCGIIRPLFICTDHLVPCDHASAKSFQCFSGRATTAAGAILFHDESGRAVFGKLAGFHIFRVMRRSFSSTSGSPFIIRQIARAHPFNSLCLKYRCDHISQRFCNSNETDLRADEPAKMKDLPRAKVLRGSYRYYVSQTVLKHGAGSCPVGRVPAGEIEAALIDQLRAVFRQPEIVAGIWRSAQALQGDITEAETHTALHQLDPLWDELFPAEQARIVALLVERIDLGMNGLTVRLRIDRLSSLARELQNDSAEKAA